MKQIAAPSQPKPTTEPEPAASATRSTILAAATPLFASSGIQGTTIRQIAAAARVNSQLIYYYFGNKVGLFRAVLEGAASRVAALLAHAKVSDGPPRERLARFVSEWVKVTLEQASTLRMLHRAMLEGDKTLAAEIQRYAAGHAAQIGSLIDEGKATGAFRADLNTRRAVASLVGMVQYLALAETILFTSTNLKQDRKERDAMAQHTAELFLRGLDAER
jgi:TetR/AcrR family transcriptional regulator